MQESILVTGGAGYIGSHTVRLLIEKGYKVTVIDDLSQGHADSVPRGRLVKMSLFDMAGLIALMKRTRCMAVLHFAGLTSVAESFQEPAQYFSTNVAGTLSLLYAMQEAKVSRLVFSSSAAVYGNAGAPIYEASSLQPCSPYGASKVMAETMLQWFTHQGLSSISLRYFNAAGADPGGQLAEMHSPETHLIPRLLWAVAVGKLVTINGNNFQTPDGTCIRDYVHVEDLAQAHALALEYLLESPSDAADCFNVGTGKGHSVLQVIRTVEEVTGGKVDYSIGPRRPGDPASLIADPTKIRHVLNWKPDFPELRSMVEHAWKAMGQEPVQATDRRTQEVLQHRHH